MNKIIATALLLLLPLTAAAESLSAPAAASAEASAELLRSYRRILPLEGGSNFRDLGGYPTADGRTVKRGMLFRSGAMTGLTEADMAYLEQFNFRTVVDLRSSEELELYPNRWVTAQDIDYRYHDYSMVALMKQAAGSGESPAAGDYSGMYLYMTDLLKPQLSLYFDALLSQQVPVVVNCSAGQDRTGVASALLLSALGVERQLIVEDYLLSTDFRRPDKEKGDVDLAAAAASNAFAAMMLKYGQGQPSSRPNPLVTTAGTPFLQLTFDAIEARYGSVSAYLDQEIGVSPVQQAQLRAMYLR
jgi:protein-tyrosine phosphatase